jgi:hypothetical protein
VRNSKQFHGLLLFKLCTGSLIDAKCPVSRNCTPFRCSGPQVSCWCSAIDCACWSGRVYPELCLVLCSHLYLVVCKSAVHGRFNYRWCVDRNHPEHNFHPSRNSLVRFDSSIALPRPVFDRTFWRSEILPLKYRALANGLTFIGGSFQGEYFIPARET